MAFQHSRARTVLIVAGCTSLAVLLGLGVTQLRELARSHELHAATRSAYDAAQPDWNRVQVEDAAVLSSVLGPLRYRSRSVRCVLSSDYAGWIVQGWRQVCTLRSVDVYPTTESYQQLSARLRTAAGSPGTGSRLSAPPADPPPAHGCGVLRSHEAGRSAELQLVVTRLEAGRFLAAEDPAAAYEPCAAPKPELDSGAVRFEDTYSSADLTPTRSWVTVVHQTQFLNHDLGCRGVLFCKPPVEQPVLP